MRAGIGLARKPHDGTVIAADFAPVFDPAAVDVGDLLKRQYADGVFGIDDDRDGVTRDDVLHRLDAVGLRLRDLLILDLARGVGDVHCAVDEGSESRA